MKNNIYNKALLVFLFAIIQFSHACFGQQIDPQAYGYYKDYLRFSMTQFGGTARANGIAGANTAIGGEISSAYSNPAGLGMMRRSEVTFCPNIGVASANSDYKLDNLSKASLSGIPFESVSANKNYLNINNFAAAISLPSDNGGLYKGGTLAFSYNRINTFHQNIQYRGTNPDNSLIDYLLESTNGTKWSVMEDQARGIYNVQGLGYFTYLINPDPKDSIYQRNFYSFVPVSKISQEELIENKGSQNQINISYGGNIDDKFYFGFGLGIQSYNFTQRRTYTEKSLDAKSPLIGFTLQETLSLVGSGFNFKAGFIYRPIEKFRIGASIVTPTSFNVTDTYDASLVANYNNYAYKELNGKTRILSKESAVIAPLQAQYAMSTPMRVTIGGAYFFGKKGFVSADIEYLNYAGGKFSGEGFDFSADNSTIKSIYRSTFNYRLGAEIRTGKVNLRAGAAYYSDPYNEFFKKLTPQDRLIFTAGAGVRKAKMYYDFALSIQNAQGSYAPYRINDEKNPVVYSKTRWINAMFSIGFNF